MWLRIESGKHRLTIALASTTHRLFCQDFLTQRLELACYLRPRVPRLDQPPSGKPERCSPPLVPKERDDGTCEAGRIILLKKVVTRSEGKAFCAHGCRDHRLPHCERLENLEPRSAADPQRHNINGCFGDIRSDVLNRSGDPDPGLARRNEQPGSRIAANHRK